MLATFAARPAVADDADRPVVVLLVTADDEMEASAILDPVRAELGDLPVDVAIERMAQFPSTLPAQVSLAAEVAGRRAAAMVFWFDVSVPGQVFVYLAEPGGSRILVRTVAAAETVERVGSAAVIVRGLVEAILGGGTIGIQSVAAPAEPASPEQPPRALPVDPIASVPAMVPPADISISAPVGPEPVPAWLGLQLGYGLDFFSDQAKLLHGLDAGLLFHVHPNWSLFATYRILFDAEISGAGMDLDVTRHPGQVGVRFHWTLGDWDVGGSISGVLDYVTAEAASRSPALASLAPDPAWLGGFGFLAHVSYRIAGSFRVFLDEGLDVLVNRVEYVVDQGAQRTILFRSWNASPRLLLGLGVDLL
ncbi:MAG: hypothetical protein HY905_18565 [Deltaproteobacteria bacterium]|nr:hypothetical protein [Deltaproteobacteria bacterium]